MDRLGPDPTAMVIFTSLGCNATPATPGSLQHMPRNLYEMSVKTAGV